MEDRHQAVSHLATKDDSSSVLARRRSRQGSREGGSSWGPAVTRGAAREAAGSQSGAGRQRSSRPCKASQGLVAQVRDGQTEVNRRFLRTFFLVRLSSDLESVVEVAWSEQMVSVISRRRMDEMSETQILGKIKLGPG